MNTKRNVAVRPIAVNVITLPRNPTFDKILAAVLLWDMPEAEEFFPGVGSAEIEFWNPGRLTPSEHVATEDWVRQHKTLPVGLAGGEFDDRRAGVEHNSAAVLVAKKIGLDRSSQLRAILKFAERVNTTATAHTNDISHILKVLYVNGQLSEQEIVNWVRDGILAKYREQNPTDDFSVKYIAKLIQEQKSGGRDWLQVATDETAFDQEQFRLAGAEYYAKKVLVPFLGIGRGGELCSMQILAIESDNSRVQRWARSKYGDRPAVIIQRRSSGNVAVMTNHYDEINLKDVAIAIMMEEAKVRGEPTPDWKRLQGEKAHGVWLYEDRGQALFNGTLATDTPPTKQSLQGIAEVVRVALSVKEFHPSRATTCAIGRCDSSRKNPCPWYELGLSRCRTIRFVAFAKSAKQA